MCIIFTHLSYDPGRVDIRVFTKILTEIFQTTRDETMNNFMWTLLLRSNYRSASLLNDILFLVYNITPKSYGISKDNDAYILLSSSASASKSASRPHMNLASSTPVLTPLTKSHQKKQLSVYWDAFRIVFLCHEKLPPALERVFVRWWLRHERARVNVCFIRIYKHSFIIHTYVLACACARAYTQLPPFERNNSPSLFVLACKSKTQNTSTRTSIQNTKTVHLQHYMHL